MTPPKLIPRLLYHLQRLVQSLLSLKRFDLVFYKCVSLRKSRHSVERLLALSLVEIRRRQKIEIFGNLVNRFHVVLLENCHLLQRRIKLLSLHLIDHVVVVPLLHQIMLQLLHLLILLFLGCPLLLLKFCPIELLVLMTLDILLFRLFFELELLSLQYLLAIHVLPSLMKFVFLVFKLLLKLILPCFLFLFGLYLNLLHPLLFCESIISVSICVLVLSKFGCLLYHL